MNSEGYNNVNCFYFCFFTRVTLSKIETIYICTWILT